MDPFERDATPNLSMRQKSALKRRITREHNSNFRAGYININEQYLHKTGIRGRKRYFLYCVLALLCLVAIVNILLTTAIIYHLKISPQHGMEFIEYIPDNELLRFLGKTVFDSIQIFNGRIGSRADKDLYFDGNNNSVIFTDTSLPKASSLFVDPEETLLDNVDRFSITDTDSGKEIFSTRDEISVPLVGDVNNLSSPEVVVFNITSLNGIPDLILESIRSYVSLSGSEGVDLMSYDRHIRLFTKQDMIINSTDGSLTLDAASGIRLDIDHVPKVIDARVQGPLTYKLCVCLPNGRIFAVPVTGPGIGCQNANNKDDPCQ